VRGDQKDLARGPGRPRWSGKYRDKCDVRLNKEESAMLDHLSELNDVSRSDVMRKALKELYKFNTGEEEK
jgi:hypothetical protein